jgi:predicted RNA-binding Zn-ribbon protein involved in translation (DUF1610 family)
MTARHTGSSSGSLTTTRDTGGRLPCPSCGAHNAQDTLRCSFCRSWLVTTARCSACQGTFLTRIERCSSCGAGLEAAHPTFAAPVPRSDASARRSHVRAGGIIGGIVLALIVGAMVTGHLAVWDGIGLLMVLLAAAGVMAVLSWWLGVGPNLPRGPWTSAGGPYDRYG